MPAVPLLAFADWFRLDGDREGENVAGTAAKRIQPRAYEALAEALAVIYWNKTPFERYLRRSLRDYPELLAGLAFGGTKRDVAGELVDLLGANEDRYQGVTLGLMLDVSSFESFPNLERQIDGKYLIE
nr:hypothetical protein [Micromonospora sp. DSM 115978]